MIVRRSIGLARCLCLASILLAGCPASPSPSRQPLSRWLMVRTADPAAERLKHQDQRRLVATVPTIELAVPEQFRREKVAYQGREAELRVSVTHPELRELLQDEGPAVAVRGQFLQASESADVNQQAVLVLPLAADIIGDTDPVGKSLQVGEAKYDIVGLFELRGSLPGGPSKIPQLVSPVYVTHPAAARIPMEEPVERMWVKVSRLSEVVTTKELIEGTLQHAHPNRPLAVESPR